MSFELAAIGTPVACEPPVVACTLGLGPLPQRKCYVGYRPSKGDAGEEMSLVGLESGIAHGIIQSAIIPWDEFCASLVPGLWAQSFTKGPGSFYLWGSNPRRLSKYLLLGQAGEDDPHGEEQHTDKEARRHDPSLVSGYSLAHRGEVTACMLRGYVDG